MVQSCINIREDILSGRIGWKNEIIDPVRTITAKAGAEIVRHKLHCGGVNAAALCNMHTVREGLLLFMFMSCNIFKQR